MLRDMTVSRHTYFYNIEDIIVSGTQYSVSLATVCRDQGDTLANGDLMRLDTLESVSSCLEKTVVTPPLPPTNIKLESAQATSLKVKWDPPTYIPQHGKLSYNVTIYPLSANVRLGMKEDRAKELESTVYQFSQLPEIIGTGEKYRVSVTTCFTLATGVSYSSEPVSQIFVTKPLPPERLTVRDHEHQIFSWLSSPSASVKNYKLKIKKDNEKSVDFWIIDTKEITEKEKQHDVEHTLTFDLEKEVEYKVNIYSCVENGSGDGWVESEPLFCKLTKEDDAGISADLDIDIERDVFDFPKTTRITLHKRNSNVTGPRPVIVRTESRGYEEEARSGTYSRMSSIDTSHH